MTHNQEGHSTMSRTKLTDVQSPADLVSSQARLLAASRAIRAGQRDDRAATHIVVAVVAAFAIGLLTGAAASAGYFAEPSLTSDVARGVYK